MRRRRRGAGIIALAALAATACGGSPPSGDAAAPGAGVAAARAPDFERLRGGTPFNLLVITLDTTRADHIGAYGADDAATSAIDGLARSGVLFRNAYSPVPLTLPAHTSLFTGLYPFNHGVRDNTGFAVPTGLTTLAEVLRGKGFRTAAFVASYVLAAHWGLDRGFDTYGDGIGAAGRRAAVMNEAQRRADEVIDDALAWLDNEAGAPFFLWVHLYDAHVPYAPPEPYRSRYAADPYAGEIAFMDAQIARLLDRLRADGAMDSTFIVVAGDHGESLGEHGELEHGFFVYEAATRVPLIIALPFAELRGLTSDVPASLVDVMPTVLEMVGVEAPAPLDGTSLAPWFGAADAGDDRVVYAETHYPRLHYGWSELASVQDERYKLILSSEAELYDLALDPAESTNRLRELPDERDRLEEAAEEMLAGARAPDARVAVDAETRRTLESLGYIAGPAASGDGTDLPAPRSRIDVYNKSLQARALMGSGDLDAAARLYDEILDEDPDVLIAYERLGEIYMMQGRYEEAAQTFSFAVPLRPDWYETYIKLAEAQIALGQPERAEATLRGALQLVAPNPNTHCMLGYVGELRQTFASALQHYRSCQQLDPDSPDPVVSMARVHLRLGDIDAAEARAREALALEEGARGAHAILAQVSSRRGQPQRAIEEYRAELSDNPDHVDAHFGLAMLYGEAGRTADEERHLESILQIEPEHPLAALFLANILLARGTDLQRAVDLVTAAVEKPLDRQDLAAAYFILSNLHQRLGNAELARQYLQRAESLR